ncbi:uncharacterized protein LOC114715097 [Neltuma alba]|uniref:uncharacterized protein LOC114715097 n=1 Tax=Neltuma alba TaxID=207710 RepID=UPI0010A57619|nr:uncharacterized protein LOC114715097 [Prosopis alba]
MEIEEGEDTSFAKIEDHALMIKMGCDCGTVVETALMDMCSKYGLISECVVLVDLPHISGNLTEIKGAYLFAVTMRADKKVLELYDSLWFQHLVITGIKYPEGTNKDQEQTEDESSDFKVLTIPAMDSRSMSENSFKMLDSFSPTSVLPVHLPDPFPTKKDITEDSNSMILPKKKRSRKIRKHMSIRELELEEVEGFKDLGFIFKQEDRHSRLALIIPGLKRLGKKEEEEEEIDERYIQRPYLSETWDFLDRKKKVEKPLKMKIPEDMSNEAKMKDDLKLWAYAVASLVRSYHE